MYEIGENIGRVRVEEEPERGDGESDEGPGLLPPEAAKDGGPGDRDDVGDRRESQVEYEVEISRCVPRPRP